MSAGASRVRRVFICLPFVVGFVCLFTLGNGRTYAFDEWRWIAERQSWSFDALFSPHNGNVHPIPVAVYLTVFNLIGLDHPEVFRLLALVIHMCIVACIGLLVGRRHGRSAGIAASTVAMLLGAGAQNIIWGFQIGMAGSVLFFLVAVLSLDRAHESGRHLHALVASLMVVLSVLFSSVGVCAVAGVAWYVAVSPRRRTMWWVPVPALATYGLWYLLFQEPVPVSSTPASLASWFWRFGVRTLTAFFDLPFGVGAVLLIGGTVLVVRGVARRSIEARAFTWLAFAGTFFGMTGLARNFGGLFGNEPPSRYLHVTMIATVLLVSDLVPRVNEPGISSVRKTWMVRVGLLVVGLAYAGIQVPQFVDNDATMRRYQFAGAEMRGQLSIVELHPDAVGGDFAIASNLGRTLINVERYLAAVARFGDSPAYPAAGLPTAPATVRRGADYMINITSLVTAVGIDEEVCGSWSDLTGTVDLAGGQEVFVQSPGLNGLIVRRFYTEDWSVSTWREVPAGTVRIGAPADALDLPWRIHFSTAVRVALCPSTAGVS